MPQLTDRDRAISAMVDQLHGASDDEFGCVDAANTVCHGWTAVAKRVVHAHDRQVCFTVEVEGKTFMFNITQSA